MRERIREQLFAMPQANEVFAGYALLHPLASGAAGDVYLVRDPKLDRTVALKVLRAPAHDEAELRRLHREGRVLAKLAHPNVVHVYEVGVHDGRLFIAMEYVAGSSLLEWQRAELRTAHDIVRCYLAAARGLAAAHAVGVVHRDVKPANILVGDDGRVRVADFGLARPVDDTDREHAPPAHCEIGSIDTALRTESRLARGGTPAYMAPETIRDGLADPRSDQFSWAVALYEALYARRPFAPAELATPASAPALSLLPRRPSGEALPTWLRASLRRALAWERDARFAGMAELADQLERAPRSRANRIRAMAVGTALVASVGATWTMASPPPPCPDPSGELTQVWDQSMRDQAAAAFAATELPFQQQGWELARSQLDQYAERWLAVRTDACEATRVHSQRSDELFDLAIACLADRRARLAATTQRLARADRATVERVDALLDTLPSVEACLDSELLRLDATFATDAADSATLADARALIATASAAAAGSDHSGALELAEAAVERARASDDVGALADALLVRGRVHQSAGDVAETLRDLADAADAAEAARHDELKPEALLQLARATVQLGEQPDLAHAHVQRARAALARLGVDADASPEWLEASSIVEASLGRVDAAESSLRTALELRRSDPSSRPTEIATTLVQLGRTLAPRGRTAEARMVYDEARALRSDTLGADHPLVAEVDFGLGLLAREAEELGTAEAAFARALDVLTRTYGSSAPKLATVHLALADLATARDDPEAAIASARRALEIQATMPVRERSVESGAHAVLANAYRTLGDLSRAHEENVAVLRLDEGAVPELELVPVRINIAHYLCRMNRCIEARSTMERALGALEASNDPEALTLLPYVLKGLGKAELAGGRPIDALVHLEAAQRAHAEHPIGDMQWLGELEWALARADAMLGREAKAVAHARAALASFSASERPETAVLAEVHGFLQRR